DAHAAVASSDARADELFQRLFRFEAREPVQIDLGLDGETALAEPVQRFTAHAVSAELDLSGDVDELAAETLLQHVASGRSGEPRPRRGPAPGRRDPVLGLQRRDAAHRFPERRALVIAAVHDVSSTGKLQV